MKKLKMNLLFKLLGAFLIYISATTFSLATGYITVDENDGLPMVSEGGKEIIQSSNIMISFAARAEPKAGGRAPTYAEPVTGIIRVKAPPGLKLYKHKRGRLYTELETTYENGAYIVNLTDKIKTYWLFLRSDLS